MTTVPTVATAPHRALATTTPPAAVRLRRVALVAAPVLAGLFAVIGAAADPAAGLAGEPLFELYADNPDRLQWKSFAFRWSYALWITPALLLVRRVRERGAWLANVAGVLAFAGATSLPGLLVTDFYDSAIGRIAGVETTVAVEDAIQGTWGATAMMVPAMLGLAFALPLALAAMWRAGLVRWWAPMAAVIGFASFLLSGVRWWGAVGTTIALTVVAVALERATREA